MLLLLRCVPVSRVVVAKAKEGIHPEWFEDAKVICNGTVSSFNECAKPTCTHMCRLQQQAFFKSACGPSVCVPGCTWGMRFFLCAGHSFPSDHVYRPQTTPITNIQAVSMGTMTRDVTGCFSQTTDPATHMDPGHMYMLMGTSYVQEVMTVGGTKPMYNVDVYSGNHPFYMGVKTFMVMDEGQLNKFKKRFADLGELSIVPTLQAGADLGQFWRLTACGPVYSYDGSWL